MKIPKTIEWIANTESGLMPGHVKLIDQTLLPGTLSYIETNDITEIWHAIKTLQVRGAPAIGIAAAMGIALAAQQNNGNSTTELIAAINEAGAYLATSRPTAVNLFWAIDRMGKKYISLSGKSFEE